MSQKDNARRVELSVVIDGTDVSADFSKYLLSATYTDNEEDKADDLQISLEDESGIWLNQWLETQLKGMEASVTVVQKNWESDGKDKVLDCGVFEIDSVDASGPPAKVTLKGTSSCLQSRRKSPGQTALSVCLNLSLTRCISGRNSCRNRTFLFYSAFAKRRESV